MRRNGDRMYERRGRLGPLGRRSANKRVAYVVNCFPHFIEAMIYREVLALTDSGYEVVTISIRKPAPAAVPREAGPIAARTVYVLPLQPAWALWAHVRALFRWRTRYIRVLWEVVGGTHERARDRWRSFCHFIEAVSMLPTIEALSVEHLHAHWAVGATTFALVVSRLLGIPFSFTAHAYDIWRERLLLPEKLHLAAQVVTCTDYNRQHLLDAYDVPGEKVRVVYHGLDLSTFRRSTRPDNPRPLILSVGRLVEQKGYECLIDACGQLAGSGVDFQCEIVGDGPLRPRLMELIDRRRLSDVVTLRGHIVGDALRDRYETADVFALLCVEASDGDRDGIPNTIVEAMAMELPVVSTRYSGVPEVVDDGTTGVLVAPGDTTAAANALRRLLSEPRVREDMGRAGRERVFRDFSLDACVDRLRAVFADAETNATTSDAPSTRSVTSGLR